MSKYKYQIAAVTCAVALFFSFQNFTNYQGYALDVLTRPTTISVSKQVHPNCAKVAIKSVRNEKASNVKHLTNTYHCVNNRGDYFLTVTKTYAAQYGNIFEKQILTSSIVRPSSSGTKTLSTRVSAAWGATGTTQNLPVLQCGSMGCNKPNLYLARGNSFLKIPGIYYGKK